jgi:hypothetical protein
LFEEKQIYFLAALNLAQRARCAAAIFRLAADDIVRLLGIASDFRCFLPFPFTLAHRAF